MLIPKYELEDLKDQLHYVICASGEDDLEETIVGLRQLSNLAENLKETLIRKEIARLRDC